jgi:hypothetical protein
VVLIIGLAIAAIAALSAYNSRLSISPEMVKTGVTGMRQALGVGLGFFRLGVSVLDALQLVRAPAVVGEQVRVGARVVGEEDVDEDDVGDNSQNERGYQTTRLRD